MDDIFLKIIKGDIPSAKVYEDEHTFAFLDINPSNKGHVLVVPKKKYRNILDVPEDVWSAVMKTVHKLAPAVKKATGAHGINISMNNEPAAGQEVFHAHVHVIPRFAGDGVFHPAKHIKYDDGEIDIIAKDIRSALNH